MNETGPEEQVEQSRDARETGGRGPGKNGGDSGAPGPLLKNAGWRRIFFLLLGLAVFAAVNYCSPWPDAVDPAGMAIPLTVQGKGAIALFLMAAVWWGFRVVPPGVTGLSVGVMQALFAIRPAKDAFGDFMDPAVMFILGSVMAGLAFTRSGLARRLALKAIEMAGERTSLVLLGCLAATAGLAHFMTHTAAAATVFPIFAAISGFYQGGSKPTNFGKSLFIGMAYAAAAGGVVSMFGSGRTPVAMGMFREFTGKGIAFTDLTAHMFVLGWTMVFLIWAYLCLALRPEKKTVPGLQDRISELSSRLGPMTRREWTTVGCFVPVLALLCLQPYIPALRVCDRAAVMLIAGLLLFLFRVLTAAELEEVPWNIVLLFGGAISLGLCLWQTGAARWIAVNGLVWFLHAHWTVFVLGGALLVLLVANVFVNSAVPAVVLPVCVVIAKYCGVSGEMVLYVLLAAAGMPFMLLTGATPNAIAFELRQFTAGEFFRHGIVMSAILMLVLAAMVLAYGRFSG